MQRKQNRGLNFDKVWGRKQWIEINEILSSLIGLVSDKSLFRPKLWKKRKNWNKMSLPVNWKKF